MPENYLKISAPLPLRALALNKSSAIPQKSYLNIPSPSDSPRDFNPYSIKCLFYLNIKNLRRRRNLQRLFSTFPGGSPGFGLLILRITLGITTLFRGAVYLSETDASTFLNLMIGLLSIISGSFLLVGFMTTIVSAIVFVGAVVFVGLTLAMNLHFAVLSEIYAIVLAAAIILLGPGAFSLDARFFGRREIIIPKKSAAPPHN